MYRVLDISPPSFHITLPITIHYMAYIPNNLRILRMRKLMYQKQVAEHLGIQATARISRWEKGLAYPDVENFLKLLDLYEVAARDVYPFGSRID